jgi:hypothetical protein
LHTIKSRKDCSDEKTEDICQRRDGNRDSSFLEWKEDRYLNI